MDGFTDFLEMALGAAVQVYNAENQEDIAESNAEAITARAQLASAQLEQARLAAAPKPSGLDAIPREWLIGGAIAAGVIVVLLLKKK